MKTAERENPNRRPQCVANRADGAASQYRSCSIMWAAKQENFQPAEKCFFLTSPFIEQILHNYLVCEARKLTAGGEMFFLDFSFCSAHRTSESTSPVIVFNQCVRHETQQSRRVVVAALADSEARQAARLNVVNHGSI